MNALRVMLVDDHRLFRKGIAALLSARPEFEVVGEAGDGLEAIERARQLEPEVILMDVAMPRCNGLEALRVIKREMPDVHVIMLTVSNDDPSVFAAIENGADGYLLKLLDPQELYDMLTKVRDGEAPLSGKPAAKILQEFRHLKQMQNPLPDDLTPREIEVLELVVRGATNAEMASTLSIAENTVKIHLRNIFEKLHLDNRIQVAVYAVRHGLVKGPPVND
jgi:two-component system nitrate/nitrite response regulator NarL